MPKNWVYLVDNTLEMKKWLLPLLLLFTSLILPQSKINTRLSNTNGYHELGMPYMQHYEPKDYNGRPDNQALLQSEARKSVV